jgi:hypothetical protein
METSVDALPKHHKATTSEKMVICASSLGTVFEWYDFYLYGSLVTYITTHYPASGFEPACRARSA